MLFRQPFFGDLPRLVRLFNGSGPNVKWIKRARWVQDGKFVTSSGVSAGMDAALFVISELTSLEVAHKVATYIEYTWHENADEDPFADKYPYTAST